MRLGTVESGHHFNIQRYAIHDGPGIRTTVFLKGCPLSCSWCHNAEGRAVDRELYLLPERCIQCGACLEVCPQPPPVGTDEDAAADRNRCVRCGQCVDVCPTGARQLAGWSVTVDELLDLLERDRPFYEESDGGVTFSGGEPLMQPEFLLACLAACRERGLHTAVDTSGYAPRDLMMEVATRTDLFLYDLKLLDDARHREYTGVPLAPILANLRDLVRAGAPIWLRVPLIPKVNDDLANLKAIGAFVAALDGIERVHVLPYHRVGSDKYRRLGQPYALGELQPPTPDNVEKAAECLSSFGLKVYKGG